jgi:hypothetical protein
VLRLAAKEHKERKKNFDGIYRIDRIFRQTVPNSGKFLTTDFPAATKEVHQRMNKICE